MGRGRGSGEFSDFPFRGVRWGLSSCESVLVVVGLWREGDGADFTDLAGARIKRLWSVRGWRARGWFGRRDFRMDGGLGIREAYWWVGVVWEMEV